MNIAQVRAQYPQYQDLSDKQLADALHAKFYSDIPIQDYYSRIGLTSPKERTWGEAAKDIAAGVVSGAGSLVQLPGQLYGLATGDFSETGALGLGKDIAKFGEEMKSAGLKAREAERAQKIKSAEEKGQWEAFKTAFGETVKDPALLTSFLAEQAPQLLVPFGAAKVAQIGTAAKAAAAAQGLTGTAAEKAVEAVTKAAAERGTRAAIGAGAVQQGADVGSQAYEDIYKELIRKGAKPEDAAEGALNLARAAGASGAIVSLLAQRLPGARTLEESFAGVPGTSGRLLGAVKGALGEGVSEIAEETGGKFGANLAMREVAPETSLTAGLGETAGMAAIGGVGMGGVSGLARRPARPEVAPAPEAPRTGPLTPEEKAELEQLTPQQKQELERQRAGKERPKTPEELLAETGIQTGKPTTAEDIARIRDEHETAVIEGLLAQDADMKRANELAALQREQQRQQTQLESEAEAIAGGISDIDSRVREGRIFSSVQDLIDRNIPFASTAINDINQKFGVINEAPLTEEERARIENIMGMVNTFTNFVNLPVLAPKPVDRFAENQAMEALIKERTERGQAQPLRAAPAAPSPSVQKAPVSQGVGEGAALRPTSGVEPSAAQDRQLVTPAPVAPKAPFAAPGGFVSSLTLSPAYEGVEPLSVEDADFELEALQNSAEKGRLTPEQFAGSEIGKRLDTAQIAFINEGLRADPVGTITALRNRLKQATAAPAAPPVEPAPVVEAAAPAEKPTFETKIVSRQPAPDGMEVHVFTTTDGYGTGLFDADAGQYVNGSVTRFAGTDTLPKAEARAAEMLRKATPVETPSPFMQRLQEYWKETVTPAVKNYLDAFNSFGVDRLEANQIKPSGMSAREWLESFVSKQSTWDKGRKTGETGIQALSTKNLWPTTDGSGERLRKAMLDAVKALKNAPGSTSELVDQAFGKSKLTTTAAPKVEAPVTPAANVEEQTTPTEEAKNIVEPTIRSRLKEIARNLGVLVFETGDKYSSGNGVVNIPTEDKQVEGAQSPEHVFAHELGHAILQNRSMSFNGMPNAEVAKWITGWDGIKAISKAFRPEIHNHKLPKFRRHANKPDEIIADALGSFLLGNSSKQDIAPLIKALNLNDFDLGIKARPVAAEVSAPKAEVPAVETPAVDVAQQVKDLREQQTKLLTKSGKVPAPRSPARQKYDVLERQIAELENRQLAVRTQKPRKPPKTIMGSPMLAGIFNKIGGLHTSLLPEFSTRFFTKRLDKKGRPVIQTRNPLVSGYGTLFNKNGKFDFGEIAEHLEEEGYLEPGSLERDYKDAGERAKELVKRALNGEEVLPIEDQIAKDNFEREASERQKALDRQEENRMIATGELQLEPEFEWTNEDIEKNLGLDREFETDLEMYDLEPKDLEFLSDEELESELTDAEREQAQARRTRKTEEDAARQKAEGAAPRENEEILTRPTAEGLKAKQEAAEKAAAEEKKAKAAEQERLRKEQQAKEEKARADETVKDFELGKSAEEQMTGMGDLFAVPPAAEKPPVGGFRRATAREANSDNAQFVYDVGNGARLLFVPSQNGDVYVAAPGKGASLVVRTGDNRDNVIKTVDQFPDYIPENIRQIVLDYHKAVQGKTTDEEQTAVAMEMAEKIEALTSTKKEAPPKREPRQGTPKQLETADGHAKSTGGTVVYQDGDIALVRGFSLLNGQPVYVVTNGDYRSRVDIEGYTGNLVTPEQKANLVKIKQDLEAEDKAKFDKSPSIKFTDGLATSANVSPELAGIVRGWKELLGLKPNLYVTTIDDAVADRNKFTGPHRAVGSAGLDANEAGQVRRLPNGDYYIAFKKGTSKTKMLEVLAHELGHMHEREVYNNADADTKKKIREEHDKWLMSQQGRSARELIQSLRAKTSGKTTRVEKGLSADQMTPYWKSFGEWYADQVSRWAVTSEKPVSVVEKFFSRLAQALKSFYSKLKNAGYLPNETFVQYLEKTHAPSDHVISTDDGSVQQMLGEAKAVAQKALQKQPMPEKGLSHVSKDLTNLAQPIFFPQNKTILDRIDSMKDRFWQRLAQKTADQFRTIKEYSPLGYMQARLSKSVDGSLEGLLFHGQVFDDGGALNIKKNTKGMMDILKPIGNELDSYLMWVALNRESTLPDTKRSKIPNMDKLVARRAEFAAGELNGKPRVEVYQDVLKQMNQLNKSVLDIALAKGLIDQAGYDKFSNDIYYIPFYKKMEEDGTIEGAQTASGLTSQYFSKELKGSEAPFGDLMENIVRNWSHILSASMKNAAAQTTLNDAMELQAAEPNLKAGLEWKDGKVYSTKSGKPIEAKFDEDGTQLYAEGELRPDLTTGAAGMAKVMVNGQPMYFKVTDDLLMDSISSIGYLGPKSKFLDVARGFKNMLQYGVTASPIFKVNNLIRDSVSALAVSDLKKSPVSNVMKGISLSKPDSPTYISALAGGAIFNFGSAYEGDQAKLIKRLIDQGVEGDTILDSKEKITKALKKTWDAYQHLGDRSEAANRLALYQQMRDKGMSHLEASFMARDLLDFSMQGSWPAFRLITQVVPFMNARIQGLYKLGRDGINPTVRVLYNATTGKEIDANDKIRAAQFATVSAAVMLASALLYLTFKDDEDFKKRDAWDRDNFWWFKIPSLDIAFRVPKPFEVGAFGTLVERSLEQILDQGAEGKTFGESLKRTLWDTFALNPTPQMFKPLLDIYANKDSFSGAPIESAGLERLSKQERVTEQTSPLAIAMSAIWSTFMPEKLESSPVQMDYAIKGYFGWLGAMASLTSTYAVMPFKEGEYPDARWLDRASLGLVRDLPAPQSAYVTAFYNSSKEISQAYADMRHYREMGDAEKVQELLEEKGDKIALAKFYDKTAKNIANVRKQIQLITNDKNLDGAEKKEMIERMKLIMSDLAKQAEEVRKSMKQ